MGCHTHTRANKQDRKKDNKSYYPRTESWVVASFQRLFPHFPGRAMLEEGLEEVVAVDVAVCVRGRGEVIQKAGDAWVGNVRVDLIGRLVHDHATPNALRDALLPNL